MPLNMTIVAWTGCIISIVVAQTPTDEPSEDRQAVQLSVSAQLSEPADDDLGEDQRLVPLFAPNRPPTREAWEREKIDLRRRWDQVLGEPSFRAYDKKSRVVDTFEQPEFRGTILRQPTGPDTQQLVLIMEPKLVEIMPRPGAVVPFYHPDPMAGFDLTRRQRITEKVTTQFGRHLVQQGYVVVCTEAFPYNALPKAHSSSGLNSWRDAATKLRSDQPNWTGMGKLVHDTRRALDLLLDQPKIDPQRIVVIGHSLGGKMAFYTGCLDERVKATIATDFGIGWAFTNWHDPWYLGDQIRRDDFALAHHQLLALHVPRPFLLIAGQYDKRESWQYLNEAKRVCELYENAEHAIGMLDHASGHQPTKESMQLAYRWLSEQFGLQPRAWEY